MSPTGIQPCRDTSDVSFRRSPLAQPFSSRSAPAMASGQPAKRAITLDDLAKIKTVGDPQRSPDGKWVAYIVGVHRRREGQARHRRLDGELGRRADGAPDVVARQRELARAGARTASTSRSSRRRGDEDEKKKGAQVWLLNRPGGEAQKLTDIEGGVSDYAWSPDSKRLVFAKSDKDPADEPEKMEGWKRKTKPPIVIDRYHFKQDREGYLQAPLHAPLRVRHRGEEARAAHARASSTTRRRRGRPTARRSPSSASAAARSRSHHELEHLRRRREGRRRAAGS